MEGRTENKKDRGQAELDQKQPEAAEDTEKEKTCWGLSSNTISTTSIFLAIKLQISDPF